MCKFLTTPCLTHIQQNVKKNTFKVSKKFKYIFFIYKNHKTLKYEAMSVCYHDLFSLCVLSLSRGILFRFFFLALSHLNIKYISSINIYDRILQGPRDLGKYKISSGSFENRPLV